jgi:hypothetical protein
MFLQIFKSFQHASNFTEKEKSLFLENQELISKNTSLKLALEFKNKNMLLEFKSHITSLIGFSSLLKQQKNKLSGEQEQYLNNIVKSAYLLNNAINNSAGIY